MIDYRVSFVGTVGDRRDPSVVLSVIEASEIIIVVDDAVADMRETQVACERGADLLIRLFDHVRIAGNAPWLNPLNERLNKTRPIAKRKHERTVVVGIGQVEADVYVGFHDWKAEVSLFEPPPVSAAPIGALLAGPLIASEAFKAVFQDVIPEVYRASYAVDALTYGNQISRAALPVLANEVDILIAGCGSVGFAIVDALVYWPVPLSGRVVLLDNGFVEERNTYKYAWLPYELAVGGDAKVNLLKGRLEHAHPELQVIVEPKKVEEFDGDVPLVAVVSVDNLPARRQSQDIYTKHAINVAIEATRVEHASMTYGDTACIYCYYHNSPEERLNYDVVAATVGRDQKWVEAMLRSNETLDDVTLRAIAQYRSSDAEPFLAFRGQPLRALLQRFPYAEATVSVGGVQARVSTAFVSSMAGTLGLVEALKLHTTDASAYRESLCADMLGIFHRNNRKIPAKVEDCAICASLPRQQYYRKLWKTDCA
jgi:hypothetical protein